MGTPRLPVNVYEEGDRIMVAAPKGDWAADIAAYDKVHNQILRMAHMLSTGIIRQFPQ